MVIINKSRQSRYSSLARRILEPGQKSADTDMGGLAKAMNLVVGSCGKHSCIRLNDDETRLINAILALNDAGRSFRCSTKNKKDYRQDIIARDEQEKKARIAAIIERRNRDEAILSESRYTSRDDVDSAIKKASDLRGVVEPKKLSKENASEISLSDIAGDNRFIEESMRHSNIRTALASEEGWDVSTMKAAEASGGENNAEDSHKKPLNVVSDNDSTKERKTERRARKGTKR